MTTTPDDPHPRSGSSTSLVLTIIGLYVRRMNRWISTADLVALAGQAGVSDSLTRTAITRLKKRGYISAARRGGIGGYELEPAAVQAFDRGDRRIFAPRNMGPEDFWCVISFSVPEERRQLRHQLRRRLSGIGCGLVAPALWICPDFLRDEVEEILTDLDGRGYATLFRAERPAVEGSLETAIARWWDLDHLRTLHDAFIAQVSRLLEGATGVEPGDSGIDDAEAFRRYIVGIDAWRVLPYLDPGLPFDLLPANWPGRASTEIFSTLSQAFAARAWAHVASEGQLQT